MTDHFQETQTPEPISSRPSRKAYSASLQAPRTVTRADLAEAVRVAVGLSFSESAELVETVLQEVLDTLANGEDVKLSSFGSFVVRSKRERVGRNPRTGEEAKIVARKVVIFRASNVLRGHMNGRYEENSR
jgi:integration host factor subunit alpha